ncbi:MAG: helix-turn-helix domain-containing protein [Nitrososphaerota archaeon]|nr:TrmB family transcriptional regulator [Candidatus Bathyarchaeota archaeon]MDW8048379.1 helix-turn-helix domain-containing protein [Nitrososphaerota archaeon]
MAEEISNVAKEILSGLGLTEYEIRAYINLLRVGATTAGQISKDANIPYSKIYEVLNSLERKGWVESRSERPKRYYPKSPVEAVEAERLRIEKRMKHLSEKILEELQPLYVRREIREKPDIWILRGEFDATAKLKEIIFGAESEAMLALPASIKPLIQLIKESLILAKSRGVKVFVLVSDGFEEYIDLLMGIGEVRRRDNMFGGGVIVDGREALLYLGDAKHPLVIWADHIGLVKFAKDYFQHLWNTAKDFE